MKILEVKNWKKVALDRDKFGQSFLRRPGPTKGCRANDDDDDDTVAQLDGCGFDSR
jgi:hypothetical protein